MMLINPSAISTYKSWSASTWLLAHIMASVDGPFFMLSRESILGDWSLFSYLNSWLSVLYFYSLDRASNPLKSKRFEAAPVSAPSSASKGRPSGITIWLQALPERASALISSTPRLALPSLCVSRSSSGFTSKWTRNSETASLGSYLRF